MKTIIHARYTLIDGVAQPDTAVCVDGYRIIAIASLAELHAQYPDADVVGGNAYILSPSFTNAHDHGRALGTTSLGISDSFLEVWLSQLSHVPHIPPYLAAVYEGLQLIKSGVTTVAHSHNPKTWQGMPNEVPNSIKGYQDIGVRVAMHPPIIDQNTLVYADRENFISSLPSEIQAVLPKQDNIDLSLDDYFVMLDDLYATHHDTEQHKVHIQVSPAGGQWCSDDLIIRAVEWAQSRQTRVQMHMLETPYQRIYAYEKWGKSFIRHLDEIGALGKWLTLAHMVWVEDDELDLLTERNVGIAHNISSNIRLRSGVAPIADMLDVGCRVGIGLDGHTLSDDQDYLSEMRLAWTIANQHHMTSNDVSASTIWQMGTGKSAQITFGESVPLGQLKIGMYADLVLLDWGKIKGQWSPDNFPPQEFVTDFLLRRVNYRHVSDVMVHGEWVVRQGKHQHVDETAIEQEIRDILASYAPVNLPSLTPHIRKFYRQWDSKIANIPTLSR